LQKNERIYFAFKLIHDDACHHIFAVSLSLHTAADDFDHPTSLCSRLQVLAQVDLSLLLDRHESGTTYISTDVILNSPYWNFTGCWRRTCL